MTRYDDLLKDIESLKKVEDEKIKISIVEITPEMADKWLKNNNENNRMLRKSVVKKYAKTILDDNWVVNGEPLIFSKGGWILSAQHRLWGVVESGKTIRALVVIGIDDEAYTTLDQGKTRTAGDFLAQEFGIKQSEANAMSNATNILLNLHCGYSPTTNGKHNLTPHAVQEHVLNKSEDYLSALKFVNSFKTKPLIRLAETLAYLMWCRTLNKDIADAFFGKFIEQTGLERDCPIWHLVHKIQKVKSARSQQLTQADVAAWISAAFNRFAKGDKVPDSFGGTSLCKGAKFSSFRVPKKPKK